MQNNISRRKAIRGGLAAAALTMTSIPALALTDATARTLVDKVVAEINQVIVSGKSENAMIRDFEKIFGRYADLNLISRSTLGADSRRATPAQLRSFSDAFKGYIARKYGKQFNTFVGGNIKVKKVRKVKSWHEVKGTVFLQNESPFEVLFLVSDRSGKDLFFDMVVEGISLRLTERTEIGSMLDKRNGDIDAMIRDLKKAG